MLISSCLPASGYCLGLLASSGKEGARFRVGHPDLYRPQSLVAQPLAERAGRRRAPGFQHIDADPSMTKSMSPWRYSPSIGSASASGMSPNVYALALTPCLAYKDDLVRVQA
jgi:hypothetical protein